MYFTVVLGPMVVLPVVAIVIGMISGTDDFWFLVGKWFVFGAVGARLLSAGLSQIFRPEFTAQRIFSIRDPEALKIVSELGFANVAAGIVAAASLAWPSFIVPMAFYGAIFYGLAGIKHVSNTGRTTMETIALVTDLAIAVILAVSAVIGITQDSGLSP